MPLARPGLNPRLRLAFIVGTILTAMSGGAVLTASAAPTTNAVLILASTVSGGANSAEAQAAQALGLTVDVVDDATWRSKSAADFASYRALILGDPGSASVSTYQAATDTTDTWGQEVTGNAVVIGTDPVDHAGSGGADLVKKAVAYAVDDKNETGLYVTLSDAYSSASTDTPVDLLAGLEPGEGFKLQGAGCYDDAHVVVSHPVIDQITDQTLSNWGCSVHNTFTAFPSSFTVLAIARNQGDTVAPDGSTGLPYILARGRSTTYVGRNLVAIGDSVSAGEGIANGWKWHPEGTGDGQWEQDGPVVPWDTTFTASKCHQTPQAHPRVLATLLKATLTHRSCTGSTAVNGVLGDRTEDDGTRIAGDQIDAVYDAAEPDLVTLSLGANDITFADIVTECVKPHPRLFDNGDCRYSDAQIDALFETQRAGLRDVLKRIADHGARSGKLPLVAITHYVDPFPKVWSDKCPDLDIPFPGLTLSSAEVDFMRAGLQRLNRSLGEIAAEYPNTLVVRAPTAFRGHEFCTTDPWIFGPSLIFDKGLQGLDGDSKMTPFHPTASGQNALAEGVSAPMAAKVTAKAGTNVLLRSTGGVRLTVPQLLGLGAFAAPALPLGTLPPTRVFKPTAAWDVVLAANTGTGGPYTISLPTTDAGASIWHFTGGAWHELQSTWDGTRLTAQTPSLSPFAVGPKTAPVDAVLAPVPDGQGPYTAAFDATASTVGSPAAIAAIDWDFGDGTSGSGGTPVHTYPRAGRYDVVLRVTSTEGAVDEEQRTVVVTNALPTATIDAATTVVAGSQVRMSAARSSDANGTVRSFSWQVGDGAWADSGPEFTLEAARPGRYTVRVLVQDDDGASATAELAVTATPIPNPQQDRGGPGPQPVVVPVPFLSKLAVTGARIRGKGRRVELQVACLKTSGRCRGTLRVTSSTGRQIGKAKVNVKAGRKAKVTIKLTKMVKRRSAVNLGLQLRDETKAPAPISVLRS